MIPPLVVIVTYNSQRDIAACLTSVLAQTVPCRVVVVDNCSTDLTRSILARYAQDVSVVGVIFRPNNVGFARASNEAIRRERQPGQVVILLNPDCLLPPTATERLLALLEPADVGIATLRVELPDGSVDAACARRAPDLGNSVRHALKLRSRQSTDGYHAAAAERGATVDLEATVGALMALSPDLLDRVGLLDEDYWMYGEDLDLCLRARDAGMRIVQAGDPVVLHVKGGSSGRVRSPRVNHAFHRAMWIYYRNHLAPRDPVPVRLAVGAGIWGRELLTSSVGVLAGRGGRP